MNADRRNYSAEILSVLTCCACLLLAGAFPLRAQRVSQPVAVNRLSHLNSLAAKLGPGMDQRLSAGGANMFHLAKVLSDPKMMRSADMSAARQALHSAMARSALRTQAAPLIGEGKPGPVAVNDASLDYLLSRIAGFTQSETSSAWCGDNVVVGFNDSGADVRSVVEGVGGASFSGVAFSQNGGQSFAGLPFLNPGTDPATFLGGDPVVVCSSPSNFLYSSLLSEETFDDQGNVLTALTGIAVNRSTDGGQSWDSPFAAVLKDGFSHFLDKEWMVMDVRHPNNIYVTYTDFDISFSDPDCPPSPPTGISPGPTIRIEIVASKDGGTTWSAPVVLDRLCNAGVSDNLSGSQVVVGPSGQVYVAYSSQSDGISELRIRRSRDGGRTFAPAVVAGEAALASAVGAFMQGGFRTNGFPTLAVSNFRGPNRGTLYMVWTDASRNSFPDFLTFDGSPYAFGDIVLSVSHDGGETWSNPTLVSPTPNFTGPGRDQFMAGVAVDARGNLAVCYSDRRNDPRNFLVDHFCSVSRDRGVSFQDVRETRSSWAPTHFADALIVPSYMGDYDTVSSDALGAHAGFFNSFQVQTNGNPDVFGFRLVF